MLFYFKIEQNQTTKFTKDLNRFKILKVITKELTMKVMVYEN